MKSIIKIVKERIKNQENTDFIKYLRDTQIPAEQRLTSWYHCSAMFAFGFKDLNNLIFKYPENEAREDKLKKVINQHCLEDGNHWPMYLKDLSIFELDVVQPMSKTLKMLWSKKTEKQRLTNYRLVQMAEIAKHPLERYCLIETIEIFGNYLFGILAGVSKDYTKETGKIPHYLGEKHFGKETGVLANQVDGTQDEILDMKLDAKTKEKIVPLIMEVCDLIEQRWQEFYEYQPISIEQMS